MKVRLSLPNFDFDRAGGRWADLPRWWGCVYSLKRPSWPSCASREGAEEDGGLHEATGAFAVPVRELWRWWWCAVAAVGGCFGSGDVLQRRWGCLQSLKRPPGPFYPIRGRQGREWWFIGGAFSISP